LLLIDTSESTIFHGLEMSRKPWAYQDKLVSTLHKLRDADEATLAEFETRLDASQSSFRKLRDAVSEFKTHLAPDELSRANSICGTEG
ncbi:hypothetical protein, partial [Xanthomonas prunicola]|uniref:hypothetical protein n=1 Tax=Xanthomonas prunicola TaxID=2053930 RepID=UPI001AD81A61